MAGTTTDRPTDLGGTDASDGTRKRHISEVLLSPNESKRATEKFYFFWFLITIPFQRIITSQLTFGVGEYNDTLLVSQGVVMGAVAWFGPLLFRTEADKGRPLRDLYCIKMGFFLAVWAMIGGYLGTDPWYEVLSGHFAFNTQHNPNDVPLFMLPMTVAVFAFYSVVLGVLYRAGMRGLRRLGGDAMPRWVRRVVLIVPLSALMPVLETAFYSSENYCFDHATGKWFLNILVYGSWQAAGLIFYPNFDEEPGKSQPLRYYVLAGFAAVGFIIFAMQIVTEFIAPEFTTVQEGVRFVNDWSPDNCLGPRPTS